MLVTLFVVYENEQSRGILLLKGNYIKNISTKRYLYRIIEKRKSMPDIGEQTLIDKAKHGDKQAFGKLVLKYADYLFAVVHRIINNQAEAEDLTQDVFVQAWQKIDSYKSQNGKFSTWLYSIATRKSIDVLRKQRRHHIDGDLQESVSDKNGADEQLIVKEINEMITRATKELSEQQKTIFVLRDLEDLSVSEVAEITGLTAKKIKDNLYVARQKIKKQLEKYLILM